MNQMVIESTVCSVVSLTSQSKYHCEMVKHDMVRRSALKCLLIVLLFWKYISWLLREGLRTELGGRHSPLGESQTIP